MGGKGPGKGKKKKKSGYTGFVPGSYGVIITRADAVALQQAVAQALSIPGDPVKMTLQRQEAIDLLNALIAAIGVPTPPKKKKKKKKGKKGKKKGNGKKVYYYKKKGKPMGNP